MKRTDAKLVFLVFTLAFVSLASGQSIGVSFYVPGDSLTGPLFDSGVARNDEAGTPQGVGLQPIPRQRFWNDLAGGPNDGAGNTLNLQDNSGVPTSVDVNWAGTDVDNNGGWQGQTSDSRFFNGQLLTTTATPLTISFVEISNDYSVHGYDVYVYADIDGVGFGHDIRLQSTPAGPLLEGPVGLMDIQAASIGNTEVLAAPRNDYDRGYATSDATSDFEGNFIVFEDRNDTAFTITSNFSVSGVQLVANVVPEPGFPFWRIAIGVALIRLRR